MKRRIVVEVDVNQSYGAECGDCEWVQEERFVHESFCELFDRAELCFERNGKETNYRCDQCLRAEELYHWMSSELLNHAAHLGEWGPGPMCDKAWRIRDKLDAPIA